MPAKETKPTYSPGLAGVIAGETEICWVDPNAGLAYRGYDIHKMAEEASFEEVAHLLLKGELPDAEQLSKFTREIAAARSVPDAEGRASNGYASNRSLNAGRLRSGAQRPFARRQHS